MAKLTISRNNSPKPSTSFGGHVPTKESVRIETKIVEVVGPSIIQERIVQVPVIQEKIVEVLVPHKVEVFVDRIVEKEIEKIVYIDKIVTQHVEVEVPVYFETKVSVPGPTTYIEVPVITKQVQIKTSYTLAIIMTIVSLIAGYVLGKV